jgi:hypothetical protein
LIPNYLSQGISRQKLHVLYEIKEMVDALIGAMEGFQKVEELPEGSEVLDTKISGGVTYRLEKVFCGKGCKGCPHGPYWYGYWKEGGKTRSKYIGKRLL